MYPQGSRCLRYAYTEERWWSSNNKVLSLYMPVKTMEHYIQMAKIDKMDTELFLFRLNPRWVSASELEVLSATAHCGNYSRRRWDLGYPAENLGFHTFRAGGATATVNVGVPDRLLKRHGRWRLEKAKDGYIEDTTEKPTSAAHKPVSCQTGLWWELCNGQCYS